MAVTKSTPAPAIKSLTQRVMPTQGADPELFLISKGEVIGAERCVPASGLPTREMVEASTKATYERGGYNDETILAYTKTYMASWDARKLKPSVVLDGVQVELHPEPATCRQGLGANIAHAMKHLDDHLKANFKKQVQVSFEPVVEISEKEYATLSDSSKALGCQQSFNIYDPHASIRVPVDYRIRSAGGHMHFGWDQRRIDPRRFVKLCDVLVGNTCVLIDRHPLARKRREVYGRAGEYRLPSYGVEYRTLSNFWLKHYILTGFVFGMARIAATILNHTEFDGSNMYGDQTNNFKWDAESDLLARVNIDAIRTAINENDRDLALNNWKGVRSFIEERIPDQTIGSYGMALGKNFLKNFDVFLTRPVEEWIDLSDPLKEWVKRSTSIGYGWEIFINGGNQIGVNKLVPLSKKG